MEWGGEEILPVAVPGEKRRFAALYRASGLGQAKTEVPRRLHPLLASLLRCKRRSTAN